MYKTEWLEEDRQRVMNMERWYILDGRHRPDHPQHGIYTGSVSYTHLTLPTICSV